MRTTRRFVRWLSVVAMAVPIVVVGAAAPPAHAVGPDLLPMTVTNNTGRGDAVYLYVLGVAQARWAAWVCQLGGYAHPVDGWDVASLAGAGRVDAGPGQRPERHAADPA